MHDPTARLLKDHLVLDPAFPFLETVRHPVFRDEEAEALEWWHSAFLWEQRQMRVNPRRFDHVPGGLAKLLSDPEATRRFAAERADEFVSVFHDLLSHGDLYFDQYGELKASDTDYAM